MEDQPVKMGYTLFPLRDFISNVTLYSAAAPAMLAIGLGTSFLAGGIPLAIVAAGVLSIAGYREYNLDHAKDLREHYRNAKYAEGHPISVMVKEVAEKAGLKRVPDCYPIATTYNADYLPIAQASTLGSTDSSATFFSMGIEQQLSPEELRAVIAHEVGHIAKSDSKMMGVMRLASKMPAIAAGVSIAIGIASIAGALTTGVMTAPVWAVALPVAMAGMLASEGLQAFMTRTIERRADRASASITGNPWALSSGLKHIVENLNVGGLGRKGPGPVERLLTRLLRTHPKPKQRMKMLGDIGDKMVTQDPEKEKLRDQTLKASESFHKIRRIRDNRNAGFLKVAFNMMAKNSEAKDSKARASKENDQNRPRLLKLSHAFNSCTGKRPEGQRLIKGAKPLDAVNKPSP